MKVGDYVRTKDGYISKITDNFCTSMKIATNEGKHIYDYIDIRKSSSNIIDLIEVGDYVNGYLIDYIDDERRFIRSNRPYRDGMNLYKDLIKYGANFNQTLNFFEEDIKSIVTKEQFSQMEYRIGE